MANLKPILELKNVSKFYDISRNVKEYFTGIKPIVKAVDNISFKIFSGETVGILGESGCGKSTLSRLLSNLEDPDSGTISFNGRNISGLQNKQILKIRKNTNLQKFYKKIRNCAAGEKNKAFERRRRKNTAFERRRRKK